MPVSKAIQSLHVYDHANRYRFSKKSKSIELLLGTNKLSFFPKMAPQKKAETAAQTKLSTAAETPAKRASGSPEEAPPAKAIRTEPVGRTCAPAPQEWTPPVDGTDCVLDTMRLLIPWVARFSIHGVGFYLEWVNVMKTVSA